MGRKHDEVDSERSKVKIFYAEAEGTSQSIQDLLRGLTAAMGNRPVIVQAKLPGANNGSQTAPKPAAKVAHEPEDLFTNVEEQPDDETADAIVEQPRRKRGEGNGNRDRNAGLAVVKSLDLMPKGKESLKDFVAKKKPENQQEHITVYVYFLKNVLEESKVGLSHIFTCFKSIGERMPMDLPQTCRNIGSAKGWIDTADQDDIKITTAGVNFVEHELPAGTATS